MAWLSNPFAFTRGPVTIIATAIYVAVIAVLVVVHTTLPAPPRSPTPAGGVNLTEAWQDLQVLTGSYHPYNSRRNDYVHDWLLLKIESILAENNASSSEAIVFNDIKSNITTSVVYGAVKTDSGISAYFESTNIVVYIRGSEDGEEDWWTDGQGKPGSATGTLVNAHYDSVSTGFGATDDGVGVVSILQLLRYYTSRDNAPKNGLVLLLNNGEEDFLNGAKAFSQHPMSKFVRTFLNLEGAGAGGRASLFRSTDLDVTKAYAKSPYPFGTVLSGDGFERGLIKSQTDYVVFNGVLGYRGLDVAFTEPRARYHTAADSTRHTSKGSIWHMLSAAIATTRALTSSDTAGESDDHPAGVWFDLFGRAFAVFRLHTLFALSVTLLVAAPILLAITAAILHRMDKYYLFSSSRKFHTREGAETVSLYGWRGFFRYPLLLLLSCAAPVALAYLLLKVNPLIAYSSEWAVWSTMVSSFVFVAWFLSRAADYARPSALTRTYGFTWLFVGWWLLLVAATVFETRFNMAGGYFVLFYCASVFLTTWISYLELFSLPKKFKYCMGKFGAEDADDNRSRSTSRAREILSASARGSETNNDEEDDAEPTEESSLLGGRGRPTLRKYAHPQVDDGPSPDADEKHPSGEQEWATSQWSFMWVLQLLILAPINLILLGQLGLLTVGALHQTGADGSSMFLVYLSMAIFTILLLSPLVPFIHRFTWHIPMFLLLVLIGTLIYNLIAFPFSTNNRLKVYFQQTVDIDTGVNNVSVVGVPEFVRDAVSTLPSLNGQNLDCVVADSTSKLQTCSWHGLAPKVVDPHSKLAPEMRYRTWVNYNISRLVFGNSSKDSARFMIHGRNTKACKLVLDTPVSDFRVHGAAPTDKRFPPVPEGGSKEIRLWSRTWDRTWTVDLKWDVEDAANITGKVVCLWSDVNQVGVIPAFDEARHFAPEWVAIAKRADGLVEAYKGFVV